MQNNSPPPGPRPAEFAKLVHAIDELRDYVSPLVGKTLTPDEEDELEKLGQAYWDALAASKLWPPQIPDPNPKDLPPEQLWHPSGLADLYTGPNRDEVNPDDNEWLFHERLQVPSGWSESMERLRRTAQRRAVADDATDGAVQDSLTPRQRTEDEEHAAVVITRINAGPQMHPLQQLYSCAERIISSAADAYRQKSINRGYWDEFGPNGNARQKAVYDFFRVLGDAALQRITSADQWGKLGTTTRELDELIHEIAWHLGQAAGVSFPSVDDERPNLDSLYADTVQGLMSKAWVFLQRLRPFVTCLSALCNSPAPAIGVTSKELDHPRKPSERLEARSSVPNHGIDTRPTSSEPDPQTLALAMQAVVEEMKLAVRARVGPVENGRRVVRYGDLTSKTASKGFAVEALEWAVHRHHEAGRISITPGQVVVPRVIESGSVWAPISSGSRSVSREDSNLCPGPTLFDWWYKPRQPGRVFPSPYHELADVLHELFWMAVFANKHGWGFDPSQINPTTNPWDPLEQEARRTSAGRRIPFAAFDPVLTDGIAELRRLVQVASGNRGVPFSALDRSGPELVRRLRELGETYAGAAPAPPPAAADPSPNILECKRPRIIADSPPASQTEPGQSEARRKSKGGRPSDTDKALRKRITEAWATGRFARYEDLARELQVKEIEVRRAVDAARKPPAKPD